MSNSNSPRPGSMRAANQKERKTFMIGAAVVFALILSLFLFVPSYPRDWANRAGTLCKVLGTVGFLLSYGVLYFAEDLWPKKPHVGAWIAFVLLVLAVATLAGFNFDFVGIANRP